MTVLYVVLGTIFGVATSLWSAKIDRQNDRGRSR